MITSSIGVHPSITEVENAACLAGGILMRTGAVEETQVSGEVPETARSVTK